MKLEDLRTEVRFEAVTSRGPGGQNVNKVASAALLHWKIEASQFLTDEQKTLILMKLQNRINRDGELFIRSDEYRDLPRNKDRGLEKLFYLITSALHKPKARKATRPTRSSQRKRMDSKTRRSHTKKNRGRVDFD
jgi:ribosome-associated protein